MWIGPRYHAHVFHVVPVCLTVLKDKTSLKLKTENFLQRLSDFD